jgi:signal transduction histidine kinase
MRSNKRVIPRDAEGGDAVVLERMPMNADAPNSSWSMQYQAALFRHLERGRTGSMVSARRLGRKAVALKLETLDVAIVHGEALLALASRRPSAPAGRATIRQASLFFAETVVPIEKTHQAAKKIDLRIAALTRKVHRRTMESAASTHALKQGVSRRQSAEAALVEQGKRLAHLLRESKRLHLQLRKASHRALSQQEEERIRTRCRLHDEIVQILIAIKLRLLTLRNVSAANRTRLKNEVAATERLVKQSVSSAQRITHEIDRQHES